MRAFVAIVPPEPVQAAVHRAAARLRERDLAIRWVEADALHLTLAFLGWIEDERAPAVLDALADAAATSAPFELGLVGLGAFPRPTDARVVWVGVRAPPQLASLQEATAERLARLGFEREQRPFSAHLTLGRARRDAGRLTLPDVSLELDAAFRVDELALMRSHLSPRGARYERVGGAGLGAAVAREA